MAFRITVQEFNAERVNKGKNFYEKGVVTYTFNGQNKQQTIMSFANPDVFKTLKNASPGSEFLVETSKNAAGYDQWSSLKSPNEDKPATVQAPGPTKVVGSNYETKEERAARQVLIVKQSSLANAVAMLSPGAKAPLDTKAVLSLAQELTDWVFYVEPPFDVSSVAEDIPY